MADSVAVVALGVRISTWRSPGFARVEAFTSLRPLDADVESLKVLSIEMLLGIFGRLLRLVLDECVRSIADISLDVALTVLLEHVFELVELHML